MQLFAVHVRRGDYWTALREPFLTFAYYIGLRHKHSVRFRVLWESPLASTTERSRDGLLSPRQ